MSDIKRSRHGVSIGGYSDGVPQWIDPEKTEKVAKVINADDRCVCGAVVIVSPTSPRGKPAAIKWNRTTGQITECPKCRKG